MKILICLTCILAVAASIFSCSFGNREQEKNKNREGKQEKNQIQNKEYKDGTYTEEGDKWQYGNENATIIISSGRITGITLRRLDVNGKEIRYEEWDGKNVNGSTRPNLNRYRVELAQRMLEKQSFDVEAISGATLSSNNWKTAVRRALDKSSR